MIFVLLILVRITAVRQMVRLFFHIVRQLVNLVSNRMSCFRQEILILLFTVLVAAGCCSTTCLCLIRRWFRLGHS